MPAHAPEQQEPLYETPTSALGQMRLAWNNRTPRQRLLMAATAGAGIVAAGGFGAVGTMAFLGAYGLGAGPSMGAAILSWAVASAAVTTLPEMGFTLAQEGQRLSKLNLLRNAALGRARARRDAGEAVPEPELIPDPSRVELDLPFSDREGVVSRPDIPMPVNSEEETFMLGYMALGPAEKLTTTASLMATAICGGVAFTTTGTMVFSGTVLESLAITAVPSMATMVSAVALASVGMMRYAAVIDAGEDTLDANIQHNARIPGLADVSKEDADLFRKHNTKPAPAMSIVPPSSAPSPAPLTAGLQAPGVRGRGPVPRNSTGVKAQASGPDQRASGRDAYQADNSESRINRDQPALPAAAEPPMEKTNNPVALAHVF